MAFEAELRAMQEVALLGGKIALDYQTNPQIQEKTGAQDIVTLADPAVETLIREHMEKHFPAYDFLGEEGTGGTHTQTNAEYRWVVDPIDGTMPYAHGMDTWGVSIALERVNHQDPHAKPDIVAGLIYFPSVGRMVWATKDDPTKMVDRTFPDNITTFAQAGQTVDGFTPRNLKVNDSRSLAGSIVATSADIVDTPGQRELIETIIGMQASTTALKSSVSAMGAMVGVGGNLPAYYQYATNLWDIAAGMIIIENAGGHVQTCWHPDDKLMMLAANTQENLELLEQAAKLEETNLRCTDKEVA
jgi:myo-inositol-1(or 4)-monophosphatase